MPSISLYLFLTLATLLLGAMLKTTGRVLAGFGAPSLLCRLLGNAGWFCMIAAVGFAGVLLVFLAAWQGGFWVWYPVN